MRDGFVRRLALILVFALLVTVVTSKSNPIRSAFAGVLEYERHPAANDTPEDEGPRLLTADDVELLKREMLSAPHRLGIVGP